MRMRWLLGGVLCLLAAASSARAGLYIPAEPAPWPLPARPAEFRQKHGEYLSVSSSEPSVRERDFPKRVREQIARLEKGHSEGKLSVDDAINLSGYYLLQSNRGAYDKAISVLTPVLQKQPKNFMVLANLANAYQGIGEFRRAADLQAQVLANWPTNHPAWTWEQLWWYRRAEKYYLTLLESRNREQLLNQPQNGLDHLFPGMPFADDPTKYLIGESTFKVRDRLPPDVLTIVEQLLLWMPQDRRLLWMFAEVLNARGDVRLAWPIFTEIVKGGNPNRLFRDHWRAYRRVVDTDPRFKEPKQELSGGLPTRPGSATVPGSAPEPETAQNTWMPDWRQLGVGFGSGLLVGMLLLLQIGQLRRRSSAARLPRSSG